MRRQHSVSPPRTYRVDLAEDGQSCNPLCEEAADVVVALSNGHLVPYCWLHWDGAAQMLTSKGHRIAYTTAAQQARKGWAGS